MSYNAFDGDDTWQVIADGIDAVAKSMQRMREKIGALRRKDTPLLRKQIEDEHRRGQDQIAEVKAELRGAKSSQRIAQADKQFKDLCANFRDTHQEYKRIISGQQPSINDDDDGAEGARSAYAAGQTGSGQSLTLLMESDDVDAIMAAENREDALRLARDAAVIRETMGDIHELIQKDGETLLGVDEDVEAAADAAAEATAELTKAREHQKSSIKWKIALGVCCGVLLLVGLIILLWQLGVFNGGVPPSTPTTPAPTTSFF
jgi:hypothetical protein